MTFGVPCEGLLQSARLGEKTFAQEYIRRRAEIDKMNDDKEKHQGLNSGFVDFVTSSDIVLGRGRPYREFPGNQPWHQLIDSHAERYRESNGRVEKTCVTMDVVKHLRESTNVRFILEPAPEEGGWKILDDVATRSKVASALQNKLKSTSSSSSTTTSSEHVAAAKRRRLEDVTCQERTWLLY